MIKPKDYVKEDERLSELDTYSILDTLEEEDYDNLTAIASQICDTPISLVSLLDDSRQWFKSHHGLDATETPKELAFCAHAINEPDDLFVIQDARSDVRFHDNPLVTGAPNVIFYAGIPLKSDNGLPMGTLCVIDNKPKLLSKEQRNSLRALGLQVMKLMELRRNKLRLENALIELENKNSDLENFATIAAHDIKSPLTNVAILVDNLSQDIGPDKSEDVEMTLKLLKSTSKKLKDLVSGLLEYARYDRIMIDSKSDIDLAQLVESMEGMFVVDTGCSIKLKSDLKIVNANRTAIDRIILNLVANAIKYNDKDIPEIEIGVSEDADYYHFYVADNGPGIPKKFQEKIFKIFEVAANKDRFGDSGNGIGLAMVKRVIEAMGGNITVESDLGEGAKFVFSILK